MGGAVGGATLSATLADGLVVVAWITVVVVDLVALAREREPRRRLGPALAGGGRVPPVLVALLVAVAGGGFVLLERRAAPLLPFHPVAAIGGLLLVGAGVALHAGARRALGPLWSGVITVRAGHEVVERGPYRRVRHPIYASFLLLAAGSLLAHPSAAVACAAVGCATGIAIKIGFEERALRRTLGEPYRRYAARVPALVPRFRRHAPRTSETDCHGA